MDVFETKIAFESITDKFSQNNSVNENETKKRNNSFGTDKHKHRKKYKNKFLVEKQKIKTVSFLKLHCQQCNHKKELSLRKIKLFLN